MFPQLNTQENQILQDAIAQITVLIAAADGKIEADETEWAGKLTEIRSYSYKESLQTYYDAVGDDFQEKLDALISRVDDPGFMDELFEQIAQVNSPLAKLPNQLAYDLYKSYTSFADHVARAAGGFLRFGSISKEEKALIPLPMITPIELIVEDDA